MTTPTPVPKMRDVVRQPTGEIDTDITAVVEDPDATELCLLVSVDGVVYSHPLGAGHAQVIGRSRSCDIVIDHPSVSRQHTELTTAPLAVRDLESRNGTRLRGKSLSARTPTPIEIGEAIQLGDAVMLVQRIAPARVMLGSSIAYSSPPKRYACPCANTWASIASMSRGSRSRSTRVSL